MVREHPSPPDVRLLRLVRSDARGRPRAQAAATLVKIAPDQAAASKGRHCWPGSAGMSDKIKIVHIINSFEFGGAEAMLCNLLLRTDRDRFEPSVVALIDDLTVAGPVLDAGIPLVTM